MPLNDKNLDDTYNSGWDSYPELSFHAAGLRAVAEAAVKDAGGGDEPTRDWPEAANLMSDNIYQNRCCECSQLFMGWKRRPVCAVCARPQASAAVPEELIEMADRFGCIAHMYNGMKRSTAERFLECLGYADLPIGWESMTLPRLLAMLAASQPEVKS